MSATQTVFSTLIWETCCHVGCGISFGMEQGFRNLRLGDHSGWYCPNGHKQWYTGKSEAEKLKEELELQKKRTEWANAEAERLREQVENEQHKTRAVKGAMTKLKNRVGNGVCPCCNRSFENLQRHISHMHPEFKK